MHSLQFDFIDWEGPGKVRFFFSPKLFSVDFDLNYNFRCLFPFFYLWTVLVYKTKLLYMSIIYFFFKWAIIYNSKGEDMIQL